MGITAITGPQVAFGVTLTSSGAQVESNEERGPSIADLGEGLLDPRPQFTYSPGNRTGTPFFAWAGLFGGPVVDQTPTTVSTNGVALSSFNASPAANSALTLATSANSNNVTTVSITAPESGKAVTVLAIDGAMRGQAFGTAGTVNLWDPTRAVARTLSIFTSSGPTDGGTWTVAGRDLYGFKITELVSVSTASSGTVSTKKAFKYITSVTTSTTFTSTGVMVGVNDVYGFPLKADHPAYVQIWWGASSNAFLVTLSSGNHTFATASSITETSTTGDPRGTWSSSVASNSTASAPNKLIMIMSPSVQNLATITSTNFTGLVGVTRVSSI